MFQHLTCWETHVENMQISVCFCKTCICLKNLENIQISVNMINRLDITDEYSVKCDFILNTVTFIDAALNVSLRKLWKCNVLWFYLFGQGVPNETKGTINLNRIACHRSLLVGLSQTPKVTQQSRFHTRDQRNLLTIRPGKSTKSVSWAGQRCIRVTVSDLQCVGAGGQ